MYEVDSLAIFVGTSKCNARCAHCAGTIHRQYAPNEDGILNEDLIYKTIKNCYMKGARSLSLTGSGEPTLSPLSVTKVLELAYKLKKEGMEYSSIHMYSNGIQIGNSKNFSSRYLPKWKEHGLDSVYVTIHDTDEKRNAEIYGIKNYPSFGLIVSRIHDADLLMRANLVLTKKTICSLKKLISTAESLKGLGVDSISAWSVRGMDDKLDLDLSPSNEELDKMSEWAEENGVRLLREKSRIVYETGKKLTLFPDGTLSNTWCQ